MWNEGIMKEHQGRLQSQVAALQFLVFAVQWFVIEKLLVAAKDARSNLRISTADRLESG